MSDLKTNQSVETKTRAKFTDFSVDLPSIIRQIRLCRSTLGAILDELESGGSSADTIEKIVECTTGVTAEIESLWEATKQSE